MIHSDGMDVDPWYKQPWAWFVLTPLIVVIISCAITVSIAFKHADDVVIDNYYKEGRAINLRLDEDIVAKQLAIAGELKVDAEVGELLLKLTSNVSLPETIQVYLDHPLEAARDQLYTLTEIAPGHYRADLNTRLKNRWYVRIEPQVAASENNWRVTGELNLSNSDRVTFGQYE